MESVHDIDTRSVQLDEPHFDDELTVVTAQPVVPLEEIAQEQTRRKRWMLAGAFALSLLLGAGTALLAIRIKRQTPQPANAQVNAEEVVTEEPSSIQGGETPALARSLETESIEEPEVETVTPKKSETEATKKPAETQRNAAKPQPVKKPVVEREEEQEPARLVDQWEERRSRRVWRRERRDRRERGQRQELFRIGEIFEGSRRRNDPN